MFDPNRQCPSHVAWLGYGGLVPFIGLAALMLADPLRAQLWSDAQVGYGAVILSFVGALHWGVAMLVTRLDPTQHQRAFIWSVVPALAAWVATVLEGSGACLILILGFGCHLAQDHRLAGPAGLPAWYLPLRGRLTVVACTSLLVNAVLGGGHG
jgi:hypothetical protein